MTSAALQATEATRTSAIAAVGIAGWLGTMSPHTAAAYATDLNQFRSWLAGRGRSFADVTPAVVTAWLSDLASGVATGKPLTAASQARKLSSVSSFYRFVRAEGLTTIDPAPFKGPKPNRDDANVGSIDVAQAQAVWAATAGKARLRALVAVMMFSGLRVSEAVALQVSDVQDQQGARVLRVMGKGSKPRTAVLPAAAVVALAGWLAERGPADGPLLSTRTGAALTRRGAHREIAALGAKVGITGLHPHSLRHTFATSAADNGVDVLRLATALGHTSPTTTMRYIRGRDVVTNSPVHTVAAAILGAVPR